MRIAIFAGTTTLKTKLHKVIHLTLAQDMGLLIFFVGFSQGVMH